MIERIFLGWSQPALASAVDHLIDRYAADGRLDLRNLLIATPGARAGRRLEELLIARAAAIDPAWFPPTLVTAGRLPEHFYEAKLPFAGDFTQQLAWAEALRAIDGETLTAIVPSPPDRDDLSGWLALGKMLSKLHRELAADALDFHDVAACGERLPTFREEARWLALARVQQAYLARLDALSLWDLQTARLYAIRNGLCRATRDVVLLGTVDLNKAQRFMLDQVAERVTALIFAPAEEAARFDGYGCLRPRAWLTRPIPVREEQIAHAANAAEQADEVIGWLASLGGRFAAHEITIGVPDAEVVPFLEQRLAAVGVAGRFGVGGPIARTAPYSALAVVADFLESKAFAPFASLMRHPSVGRRLAESLPADSDWLSRLDKYQNAHLPARVDGTWLDRDSNSSFRAIYGALEKLLGPLSEDAALRPVQEWAEPIAALLIALFGREPLDPRARRDRQILLACEAIRDTLRELQAVPASLMPQTTAAEAIRLALRQVDGQTIAAPSDSEAIELLGWLELPLDDAPALVVTSLNEGIVPGAVNADQFLPNQLRHALGIEDNDRRYARDAYALSMILASRREVRLLVARHTTAGDPLLPSRLLFACDDDAMARRARRLFDEAAPAARLFLSPGGPRTSLRGGFEVPLPRPLRGPVRSMRVTEFRDYLACPYRYYLRHRLHLEPLDDRALELDGAAFGSLAHEVLRRFGKSEMRDAIDAAAIQQYLSAALDRQALRQFGKHAPPAVAVQIEQLRARLDAFAAWQADWAAQGWRIEHAEIAPPEGAAMFEVDGRKMELRGRIDRIDANRETGEWIVLDYKTSDAAQSPDKMHRKRGEWVDLQLPLYRHLLTALDLPDTARLGYLALPKDRTKVGQLIADWDDDLLAEADQTARDVVRRVWAEDFWPPAETPPPFSEAFAAICQDYRFGRDEPEEIEA